MRKILIVFSGLLLIGGIGIFLSSCDDDAVDACGGTCGTNATCVVDTNGAGTCTCDDGFSGDGVTCTALKWNMVSAGGRHIYNNTYNTGHSCGIREGQLFCWGDNSEGQLGTGDFTHYTSPKLIASATDALGKKVGTDTDWSMVATGGSTSCAIKTTGALYCWGANKSYGLFTTPTYGLLGLGDDYDDDDYVNTPTQVGTATDWTSVSVGQTSSCGIRDDGTNQTVWCWGRAGNTGNLGTGDGNDTNVPTQEATSSTDWDMVVTSPVHGSPCGIRDDGTDRTLWCWGEEFGSGYSDSNTPIEIETYTDWLTIATGSFSACGIRDDGTDQTLWCRGNGNHGQMGNGSSSQENTFAQVGSDTDWEDVVAGIGYFCGLRNSGKLYCWGRDHQGELGLGNDLTALSDCNDDEHGTDTGFWDCYAPQAVAASMTFSSIGRANSHICGIANDELYCWGANGWDQTGVATTTIDLVVWDPTKVE